MPGWLDSCHSGLWCLFELEHKEAALLRLFRYSSFVWRIYGKRDKEEKYLRDLVESGIVELPDDKGIRSADREKAYAMLRVRRVLGVNKDQLPSPTPNQ